MRTADWALRLAEDDRLRPAFEDLNRRAEWSSTAYEARPVLLAAEYLSRPRKTLVVAANHERALHWQAKLQLCGVPADDVCYMPSGGTAFFEDAAPEHVAVSDRLGALRALVEDRPQIIVATPQAALERTLPKEVLLEAFLEIRSGDTIELGRIVRQLVNLGYEPQDPVRLPGQFSQRGGILDVFATGHDQPYRIELFGDEVESVRVFDPSSQRSIGQVEGMRLAPSRETLYTGDTGEIKQLILDAAERESTLLSTDAGAHLLELAAQDAETIGERVYFDRLDLYRPLLHPDSGCAIDLMSEGDLLVLDEPLELESIAARAEEELGQVLKARVERGEILQSTITDFMLPPEELGVHDQTLALTAMNAVPSWFEPQARHELNAVSLHPYRGRAEALAQTLKTWTEQGFSIVFTTDQPNRAKSVLEQIEIHPQGSETGLAVTLTGSPIPADGDQEDSSKSPMTNRQSRSKPPGRSSKSDIAGNAAFLAHGNLAGGFVLPELKLAFVTDAELFGVARLRLPQRRFTEGAPVATVLDLKPGDYVVHIHFGIGVFRGLIKRPEHGIEKEFLFIEYQSPDKLFVPADQLDRIQKYLNPGDEHPKLNRLTGGEWQRTISKAKEDAKKFAAELIRLYAARQATNRRPYGEDTPWQAEMEATFPWVETPSQLQSVRDTKRDMQQPFPMDRLICGDVGFGKTEIAIRAAFKAVQAGRQVAVLTPTTILSEQHFRNFKERLDPFGVRMALSNRFRSAADKKEIEQGLRDGTIDLVIGTHSLLGKDIEFKNLGLVVIDEEQRFGVKQKEMLKHLRTEVDVLTMSATPIPRTLSMALMDIRQMSLITDPPPGRLPVRTFVRPYASEVVREAVLRELSRGGQVFYVYNRVESIGHVAEKLRNLVPTARIGVAHGQMTEKELEPVMIGFIKGEIDVLLSTTIVESGLDIPNANTLIVEGADRLGLAQLYQLRGRVGRSDRQAYAYLLFGAAKELTEGATARLQALQEFSTLGSGYSLAFRDLQIRGAGELLGAKQHGAMAAVGYELYTQLINEAVHTLKAQMDGHVPEGTEPRDPLEAIEPLPVLDVPVEAFLPDTYIKDQAQRLYYYQGMMSARTEESLGEVQAQIEDRYGHAPVEVHNAFTIMALRIRAKRLGMEKIEARGGRLAVQFKDPTKVPPRVFTLLNKRNRECFVSRDNFVWPFSGDPISAAERMIDGFDRAYAEMEEARQALEV